MRIYEDAIEEYVNKVSRINGVSSIYTMGSINAPGLSDIDILVVVDSDFDDKDSSALSTAGRNNYLFIHGPVVIPRHLAPLLQYIIYASGLTLHYGEHLLESLEKSPCDVQKTLKFAYLIDFLESRQLQFAQVERTQKLDMRAWMARMWSLTHSEQLLVENDLILDEAEFCALSAVRSIREEWNDGKLIADDIFMEAYISSISASKSIWIKVLNHCYGHLSSEAFSAKCYIDNKLIYFDKSCNSCEVEKLVIGPPKARTLIYCCHVNSKYAYHLSEYGFRISGLDGEKGDGVLKKRAKLVMEHWKWLRAHAKNSHSMTGYIGTGGSALSLRNRAVIALYSSLTGYQKTIQKTT